MGVDYIKKDPEIRKKFAETFTQVQKNYGISDEEYSHAMDTFREDEDLKSLIEKLYDDYQSACVGLAPELASKIPDFLTPEKTLEVLRKLNKVERERLREYLDAALEKDPLFWENHPGVTSFFCAARVNLRVSDEKREIFVEEGLDAFEEAPERILDTAIAKYAAENSQFQQEVEYLQRDTAVLYNTFEQSGVSPS